MRPYSRRINEGVTMIGQQIAKVIESKNKDFPVGTIVLGSYGWRSLTVVQHPTQITPNGSPMAYKLTHVDKKTTSLGLGVLGMPGATAYFGFLEICKPVAGETVLVNAAAGAVGSIVGQIAKVKGCRVVGCAGTDEKCNWLKKDLGFDAVINYKKEDIHSALKVAAPSGVDCYFDNVGGEFTDTVILKHMNKYGRVSLCGLISGYNVDNPPKRPELYGKILFDELTIRGFIVYTWYARFPEAFKSIQEWIDQGKLKFKEHTTEGFEKMPDAFIGLLKGENTGKAIVKV